MGQFMSSYGKKYIFFVVDYVSKLIEVVALPENDSRIVAGFFKKNIFSIFCSHFFTKVFNALLTKYGV